MLVHALVTEKKLDFCILTYIENNSYIFTYVFYAHASLANFPDQINLVFQQQK